MQTPPEVQVFAKRVIEDGGIVVDLEYCQKYTRLSKQLIIWSNGKFLGDANFAVKLNGSGVTKFYDLSGNNNDATQGTVANQPIWTANQQNGRAGLVFDGGGDTLVISDNALLQFGTGSFSCVAGFNVPWFAGLTSHTIVSKNYTGFEMWRYNDTTAFLAYIGGTGNPPGGVNVTSDVMHLGVLTRNIDQCTLYADGVAGTPSTNSTNVSNVGTNVYLGARINNLYLTGKIYFQMVFNIALTTAQRTALETFVNAYYSIY